VREELKKFGNVNPGEKFNQMLEKRKAELSKVDLTFMTNLIE
jgi:hypothetical protein